MSDPTHPTHYHLPATLLDSLSDAVLVFERSGRLHFANQAALRLLPCEPGMGLADLDRVLDVTTMLRLRSALAGSAVAGALPAAGSGDLHVAGGQKGPERDDRRDPEPDEDPLVFTAGEVERDGEDERRESRDQKESSRPGYGIASKIHSRPNL